MSGGVGARSEMKWGQSSRALKLWGGGLGLLFSVKWKAAGLSAGESGVTLL